MKYLHRSVVVRQVAPGLTPNQAASVIVDRYNAFADDSAVRECYHPDACFQFCIDNKTGNQAGVQCANIPNRVPDLFNLCSNRDLFAYRRHLFSISSGP